MEVRVVRIGVMADTHDRVPAVTNLLERLSDKGVSIVMHAGDYCSPFSLAPFHERGMALLGVFGRNDGDRETLSAYAARGMGTEIYESPHSFEVGGKRILLVHDLAEVSNRSIESHDFVIHGSSHLHGQKTVGKTILLNPGEACGWIHGKCTASILDLDTGEVENLTL
ncbi:MAG TPA: metallophosphoesterase [Gemmatimonadaceae bacterium]|nr:metallophosphoesterase [Gemmatimonadaceae bacterium]